MTDEFVTNVSYAKILLLPALTFLGRRIKLTKTDENVCLCMFNGNNNKSLTSVTAQYTFSVHTFVDFGFGTANSPFTSLRNVVCVRCVAYCVYVAAHRERSYTTHTHTHHQIQSVLHTMQKHICIASSYRVHIMVPVIQYAIEYLVDERDERDSRIQIRTRRATH